MTNTNGKDCISDDILKHHFKTCCLESSPLFNSYISFLLYYNLLQTYHVFCLASFCGLVICVWSLGPLPRVSPGW